MKLKKIDSEYILYTILIVGASFLFFYSSRFSKRASYLREGTIMPEYWPRIILGGIILLTAILLISKIYRDLQEGAADREKQAAAAVRLILLAGLCFLYANIIAYIGYLLGTLVFAVLVLFLLGIRKPLALIVYPFCVTTVVYLIFTKMLYMSLPRGVGIFYEFSQLFY